MPILFKQLTGFSICHRGVPFRFSPSYFGPLFFSSFSSCCSIFGPAIREFAKRQKIRHKKTLKNSMEAYFVCHKPIRLMCFYMTHINRRAIPAPPSVFYPPLSIPSSPPLLRMSSPQKKKKKISILSERRGKEEEEEEILSVSIPRGERVLFVEMEGPPHHHPPPLTLFVLIFRDGRARVSPPLPLSNYYIAQSTLSVRPPPPPPAPPPSLIPPHSPPFSLQFWGRSSRGKNGEGKRIARL